MVADNPFFWVVMGGKGGDLLSRPSRPNRGNPEEVFMNPAKVITFT